MKYHLLLFCLLLSAGELFAQGNPPARVSKRWLEAQDSTTKQEVLQDGFVTGSDMDKGFGIHLMPFSFINVLPRLRLGAQFKSKRFRYLLDLEYGFDNTAELLNDLGKQDYQFFGIRPEIRYDVGKYNRNLYLGLEIPFSIVERNIGGDFTSAEGEIVIVDRARQHRLRFSAIGKVGFQRLLGQHFYLDAYTGLGIFYRNVEYTDRVGNRPAGDEIFREWGFFGPVQEGKRWLPELALGIRFGYWF